MSRKIDMTGLRFERYLVVSGANGSYWLCLCDCGVERLVRRDHLISGKTKSCGCLSVDQSTKHGMHGTPTYQSWADMIRRCTNPDERAAKNYADVKIEDSRWFQFSEFFADMGIKPYKYTLERKDNNRGYCRDNCEWADYETQNLNRRKYTRTTKPHVVLASWALLGKKPK